MINNDYLRGLRYILDISDGKCCELIQLSGEKVSIDQMKAYLKNEDEAGFIKCPDEIMAHFLDGLIFFKRGKDDSRPRLPFEFPITNNIVLKKVKVAFALNEDDMHEVLSLAGFKVGRSELSAFLRKKGHENYRECGDQFLRNFFKGLSLKFRA